jgi:hypothetical protein
MRKLVIIGALALIGIVGVAVAATTATAVVCTGVENRAPVGAADSFAAGVGSLACFSEVHGGAGKVVHVWFHGDKELAKIELSVQGERWRTWSQKKIPAAMTGAWHVEVRSEDGTVLAKAEFTIK